MSIESLYRELILQHYRNSANRGELNSPSAESSVANPLCGDTIRLQLEVAGGRIVQARFTGQGCAVSQASASMMTRAIEGLTISDARELAGRFEDLLAGKVEGAVNSSLGDLRALAGVARFPARIRCALLAWHALNEAEMALSSPDPRS